MNILENMVKIKDKMFFEVIDQGKLNHLFVPILVYDGTNLLDLLHSKRCGFLFKHKLIYIKVSQATSTISGFTLLLYLKH